MILVYKYKFVALLFFIFIIKISIGQTKLQYYGVHGMEPNQYPFLKDSLKGNFALVELPSDTVTWKNALNEAEKNNINLIIWPLGHGHQWTPWAWDFTLWGWDISEGMDVLNYSEKYIISGGQNLLAVLMSHEPFYNNGSPFSTVQMKSLYSALKNVAPHVKLFVYMNDMAYYDSTYANRRIEDGIMDIAGIWKHWFGTQEGTMEDAIKEIDDDYRLIKTKGLHIQLFFALQTFGTDGIKYRMPSVAEMRNWGQLVLEKNKLDGVFWYPWDQSSTDYRSWLSKDRYDDFGEDRWSVVTQLSTYLTETDVKKNLIQIKQYQLFQNYPNPFNPNTTIEFSIAETGIYTIKVYNLLGKEVKQIFKKEISPGNYKIDFKGHGLPSGIYLYKLIGKNLNITKKMILLK